MGTEVFRLIATIKTNGAAAVAELKGVEATGKTMGARLGKTMKTLAKVFKVVLVASIAVASYALGKFFVSSIKTAAEFEQKMAAVKAVTGATGKEYEVLEKKAKDLGRTSEFTLTQIAEGLEALGRAGFDVNKTVVAMDGVVALASSQMIGLGEAAEIAAGMLNGMRMETEESARVANALAAAASSSNTTVQTLSESMKYFAPICADLNIPLEEGLSIVGKLGDANLQGSMATRSLATAFLRLADPTKEMTGVMEELNIEFFNANGEFIGATELIGVLQDRFKGLTDEQKSAALSTLFGAEAVKQFSVLVGVGAESLEDYQESITDTTAAFDQMEIRQNTLSGQIKILKGSWDLLKTTVGEKLIPILQDFVKETLIPLVNSMAEGAEGSDFLAKKFKAFIDKVKEGIEWVVEHRRGLVTALEAVTIAFGALIALKVANWITSVLTGFTTLGAAIAAGSPVGLALVGIGALFLIAYQAGKVMPTVLGNIKKGFERMGEEAGEAAAVLHSFNQEAEESQAAAEALATEYEWFIKSLEYGQGPIGLTTKDLETLKGEVKEAYEALEGAPSTEAAMRQWSRLINEIIDSWSEAYPELQKLHQGAADATVRAMDRMHAQGVRWAEGTIARALAVADAQGKVTAAYEVVGEETQKAIDRLEEMETALSGSEKGTIEYALAVRDLQKLYGELSGYQDFFVENNMEVDKTVLDLMDRIKALGVVVEDTADEVYTFGDAVKDFFKDVKSAVTNTLSGIIKTVKDHFGEMREEAKEHGETLEDIHQNYADRTTEIDEDRVKKLKEINEGEAESLKDLRDDYKESLGDIQDLSEEMADLQGDRLKSLAKQQESYADKIADLERGLQRSRLKDEERFQDAREDTTVDYNRSIEDENTRYGRDLADLEEEIAKASGDRLEDLLDRKEELTEDHGERLADIELRKERRLEDIQTNAARAEEERVQEEVWQREKIETDHKDRLEEIEKSYTEHVAELYEERDAKLEEAEQDFQERRTEIVDTARQDREKIEEDYNTALVEAQAERDLLLADEEQAYRDSRTTILGIVVKGMANLANAILESGIDRAVQWAVDQLWAFATGTKNALTSAKDAASTAAAGISTALDVIGGIAAGVGVGVGAALVGRGFVDVLEHPERVFLYGKVPEEDKAFIRDIMMGAGSMEEKVAALKTEYGSYAEFLKKIGLEKGGIVTKPSFRLLAEHGVPEAVIPLPRISGAFGQGQLAYAGAGGGGQTTEVHIHMDEATFNVREEMDIPKIAKELGDEFEDRIIGKGRVSP